MNIQNLNVTKKVFLPVSWRYDKLKEVIKVKHGRNQKKVEVENGPYPILGSGGKIGEAKEFLWDKPSVLIGRKGTINKPQFYDTPFWTVDTLFYTKILDGYDPKWVYYLFQKINWLKYNEASGVPSLSASNIENIKVLIPPLEEQKQIADILSTWDRAIELKDKLINKKTELLDATIQRYKRKLFKSIDFDTWTKTKLKKVFSVRKEKDYESEEQPLYSFTIENGVSPKTDRYNRSFLVKGDKKYKVTKFNDLVYNPANLKYGAISVNKNPDSVLISPIYETLYVKDTNKYDIDFFKYFLTTSEMISYYKSKVEGTLVERSAVKVDQFLLFTLDVPEYNVQKQVTNHLNTIDKSIDILKRQKEMLELQKKGLMQRLLTGQVRVQV